MEFLCDFARAREYSASGCKQIFVEGRLEAGRFFHRTVGRSGRGFASTCSGCARECAGSSDFQKRSCRPVNKTRDRNPVWGFCFSGDPGRQATGISFAPTAWDRAGAM